ncbi:MAG: hypothetical protein NUW37_14270 [Planctomycetes bacterium]|nr:hypothetical protein [Planctomycetota bacterium]
MIPNWNAAGVLPPIRPGFPGETVNRSPYRVSTYQLVDRFGNTSERLLILQGLLDYRKALYEAKITSGFQWIDGSFVEQVENLESRDPNDVDVVTFYDLPDGVDQYDLDKILGDLYDSDKTKEKYRVDAYFQVLGKPISSVYVRRVSYWYSMWSHRRDGLWKGFLEIDLSSEEDKKALELLESKKKEGGTK